jgi:hypothetical protein
MTDPQVGHRVQAPLVFDPYQAAHLSQALLGMTTSSG